MIVTMRNRKMVFDPPILVVGNNPMQPNKIDV